MAPKLVNVAMSMIKGAFGYEIVPTLACQIIGTYRSMVERTTSEWTMTGICSPDLILHKPEF